MASKKTKKGQTTSAIVKWDEELAKQAEIAASMTRSSGGGKFFSTKGGVLSWNDAPLPNNQMAVIIVASILENVYYEGAYDPDNASGPTCFAFGTTEKDMAPHEVVKEAGTAVNDKCATCPNNEWGSADKGRGKACRNTVRLALLAAGTFNQSGKLELFDEEEHFETGEIGYFRLPVTSVKGYDGFVRQLAGALKRPPHGVVTKVKVVPDPKTQFKVTFEPIVNVPNELLGIVMKRREEQLSVIDFPYQPNEEEKPQRRGAKGKARKY